MKLRQSILCIQVNNFFNLALRGAPCLVIFFMTLFVLVEDTRCFDLDTLKHTARNGYC